MTYGEEGLPGGSDGKESACNEGDPSLTPWVEKSPWSRKWQTTPILGKPGSYSPRGDKESNMTEELTLSLFSHGEQTCGCQEGGEVRAGWTGSLRLVDT